MVACLQSGHVLLGGPTALGGCASNTSSSATKANAGLQTAGPYLDHSQHLGQLLRTVSDCIGLHIILDALGPLQETTRWPS